MSALIHEIVEQPSALERLIERQSGQIKKIADLIQAYEPHFVMIAARGSSDNAARYGQYLFGSLNRLAVGLATPSLFTLYKTPPSLDKALVIAISQSGQSPDIRSIIEEGNRQGALTIALTNDIQSPLATGAKHYINLSAGSERSIAATKTYTTSLLALALLSAALSKKKQHAKSDQSYTREGVTSPGKHRTHRATCPCIQRTIQLHHDRARL